MYLCVLVYLCSHVSVWGYARGSQRTEEGTRSAAAGVSEVVSSQHGCWEPNSGPLQEQCMLQTAEPNLQPLHTLTTNSQTRV